MRSWVATVLSVFWISGSSTVRLMCLVTSTSTIVTFRGLLFSIPPRNRATSSGSPTVAESPIRWKVLLKIFVNS